MRKATKECEKLESESESEEDTDDDIDDDDDDDDEPEKWRRHYSSKHKMLLVGDGDFSFSLCLARTFGSAHNMVATTIDTQENIEKKYSNGVSNVRELEERGCLVLYEVDAKQMSQHFFLRTQRFDRIVYNFPHVGFLYREGSYCQIQLRFLAFGFIYLDCSFAIVIIMSFFWKFM
ncbi:nucleic acid binding protein, putative [Ricinus communis]|uniref:Nucleic acid binding protein, putative n=1 Tax=Ricinus communis TaxID=3988 RepID=B9T8D5_RICCO|nr:nucleic acid binding protein, putative [Ricinus communis]